MIKKAIIETYDNTVTLLAVRFLPVTSVEALRCVTGHLPHQDGSYYCFANIHLVMESNRDAALKDVLNKSAGVFADGMGTAGALKYLSHMFKGRVRGSDMMLALCAYAADYGLRIFLYGNTVDTLTALSKRLKKSYPGIRIVGTIAPPFHDVTEEEDQRVVDRINRVDPHFIFVSLGAPKQEKWMAAHKDRIKAVQLGVGAAFDYIAGNLKEAPSWMQRHYLEWLYRLPQQPKKTVARMALVPEFLMRLFIQKYWH